MHRLQIRFSLFILRQRPTSIGILWFEVLHFKWLKLVVKNNLVDQFKQTSTSMIENSSKGDNYKLFKHDLKFEDYLDVLDDKDKFLLVKFGLQTIGYR
jgi:hypothetical protein